MYDIPNLLIAVLNKAHANDAKMNKIDCILEDLRCDHNEGIQVLPESVLNRLNEIEKLLETRD